MVSFFKEIPVSNQRFYWQKFESHFTVISTSNSHELYGLWIIAINLYVGMEEGEHEHLHLKRDVLCSLPKSSLIKKRIPSELLYIGSTAPDREF